MNENNSCELIFRTDPAVGLSAAQRVALEKLAAGESLIDAADAAGVSRSTVYRWLDDHEVFRSAHRQWREDLTRSAKSRLMGLTDSAVTAVARAVEAGDARVAVTVLQKLGILAEEKEG